MQFPQRPAPGGGKSRDVRPGVLAGSALDREPGEPAPVRFDGVGPGDGGEIAHGLPRGVRRSLEFDHHPGAAMSGHEFIDGTVGDDAPLVDDDDARARLPHLLHHVRAQEDGAVGPHVADEAANLDALVRIESLGRLVEDEDLRLREDGLREADALPITLRELVDRAVVDGFDAGLRDDIVRARADLAGAHPAQPAHERDVFAGEHVPVEGVRLGQVADAAPQFDGVVLDGQAIDGDRAPIGFEILREEPHGRRLARAVRPEEADDFAAVDRERRGVDRDRLAERLHNIRKRYE